MSATQACASDDRGPARAPPALTCARPPFALERLEATGVERRVYHLSKPGPDGSTELLLTPLEFIDRLAVLIPPPRLHRHRYHGVLAPNAPLRAALTALAGDAAATPEQPAVAEPVGGQRHRRSPARYLWAMLIARIYEVLPLVCTHCATEMRTIALVTETASVIRMVQHIGESTKAPALSLARGPPAAAMARQRPRQGGDDDCHGAECRCRSRVQRLLGQESFAGETHNQALRSLGRNLVRVMWSVLEHGRDYHLESPSRNT